MKKMLLTILTLVVGACASPTAPRRPQPNGIVSKNQPVVGDPCTTSDGRSGYIVYAGNKLTCQPS